MIARACNALPRWLAHASTAAIREEEITKAPGAGGAV
jgi:hypothetical protein